LTLRLLPGLILLGACSPAGATRSRTDGGARQEDASASEAGATGSRDSGTTRDAAPPAPLDTTINGIDTGAIPAGSFVHVGGVVLVAPVRSAGPDQKNGCTYDAYVQDPVASAPAGVRLFVDGDTCTGDAATCQCALSAVSTILDSLTNVGDVYDVEGSVSIFTFDAAPDEHSIYVSQVTKTGTGPQVAPLVVTDAGTSFSLGGQGFAANEGMLVTVSPGAPLAVSPISAHTFTFAGARVLTDYPAFDDVDGGPFPPAGSTWSSVTGVAWTAYGGAIAPRSPSDFAR
jgi:hypothetical protein